MRIQPILYQKESLIITYSLVNIECGYQSKYDLSKLGSAPTILLGLIATKLLHQCAAHSQ